MENLSTKEKKYEIDDVETKDEELYKLMVALYVHKKVSDKILNFFVYDLTNKLTKTSGREG